MQKEPCAISVIVPVYNVELYLSRCLDSVLSQTFDDFEIVIVDDGSTDSSGRICDEYASKHSNILLFHTENKGLSSARNLGVEKSHGEYITFVDSDDVVADDYLDILYRLVKTNNADVSCSEFAFFSDPIPSMEEQTDTCEKVFSGTEAARMMLYGKLHGSSACAILLQRSILENNPFTAGKYHEDDFVSFKYYLSSLKVASTSKRLYYYFVRVGSITHRPFGKAALDELEAADFIVDNCKAYDNALQKAACYKQYENYMDVLRNHPNLKDLSLETYKRILKKINQLKFSVVSDRCVPKRTRLNALFIIIFGLSFYQAIRNHLRQGA